MVKAIRWVLFISSMPNVCAVCAKPALNKFCSHPCYWKSRRGKPVSPEIRLKIGLANKGKPNYWKGKKRSEETKQKMRLASTGRQHSEATKKLIGEKGRGRPSWNKGMKGYKAGPQHYLWSGDKVGYGPLHSWVKRHLGEPDTCEHCGKSGLKGRYIDWANKSHQYLRDLSDWIRLCRSCHAKYDAAYRRSQKGN